jgi:hypothetical protein
MKKENLSQKALFSKKKIKKKNQNQNPLCSSLSLLSAKKKESADQSGVQQKGSVVRGARHP